MNHEVVNQPPLLVGGNAYRDDPLLARICAPMAAPVRESIDKHGRFIRTAEAQNLARLANSEIPRLRTHDRQGRRIDRVEFHPAYHALMRRSVSMGLHSSVWDENNEEAGMRHRARAARFYLTAELECGHLCPITMTGASLAALMASEALFRKWAPRIVAREYDSSHRPLTEKTGLTIGMGMTEKQGGTDVRANATRAEPAENGLHRIDGHKWFMSAPMCDAFLILAQAVEGLSCFLVPRMLTAERNNGLEIQRLKEKLGNRSNASCEVEFRGALGQMVGEAGHGVRTIMDMVTLTRLDCVVASAGIMRAALAEAVHHARHRSVFGKMLVDQPIMTRVLADMALDVAAATALSFRLARSFDEAANSRAEAAFARAMTPAVKYWVCKLVPAVAYEAMECLGGNGYVEEAPMARYYREAPLNAIWEGSGNVMALDILRVLARGRGLFDEVLAGIADDLGDKAGATVEVLRAAVEVTRSDEGSARILTEQLALAAAAAELKRLGIERVADAFIDTRLGGQWRGTYGMLDARHDGNAIIDSLYAPAVYAAFPDTSS